MADSEIHPDVAVNIWITLLAIFLLGALAGGLVSIVLVVMFFKQDGPIDFAAAAQLLLAFALYCATMVQISSYFVEGWQKAKNRKQAGLPPPT